MAGNENEAEVKKITELDFGTTKVEESLKNINSMLEKAASQGQSYAKKINDELNKIDSSKFLNVDAYSKDIKKMQEQMKKYAELSKTQQASVSTSLYKEINKRNTAVISENAKRKTQENNTIEHIKRNEADLTLYKQKMAIKAQNAIEAQNARRIQSEKTIADKIQEYAKTYLIYQGFNQLKSTVSDTINEMVEVESQMISIERVMEEGSIVVDNYRDKLIQLAYEYGNSFENVADITLRLAQAGFDASESLALAEKTLLALNTADLDATQATEDMVAVMAQWGLMTGTAAEQANEYGNIIDKINKVADNFPTTSQDIMEALKKTSSAFNLAGASIDETIATIVAAETASQRGGKAIGTALSNITQQLKEESKISIAESLGLDFYTDETKTQFKDLMDILGEMSEKMQQLKDAGKENSTEMQELLSIFTVFRRNIGASLLGEMSGEDNTYLQALQTSLNSVGYSINENEKYMKSAAAAQQQFNATLLELKTKVWDEGLEEVFRSLLTFGTDFVTGINELIDKIGLLPTSVGTLTMAFSLLNKSTQASTFIKASSSIKQISQLYDDVSNGIVDASQYQLKYNAILSNSSKSFQDYSKTVVKGGQSVAGYTKYLTKSTAQTILFTAKTVLLQAAISGGLSLAIGAIVKVLDEAINAETKYFEKLEEEIQAHTDAATEAENQADQIEELAKQYKELTKSKEEANSNVDKIYELQEQINSTIKESGKQVQLVTTEVNEQGKSVLKVNEGYKEQLSTIKAIAYENKRQTAEELRQAAEKAREARGGYLSDKNAFQSFWEGFTSGKIDKELEEAGINFTEYYNSLSIVKSKNLQKESGPGFIQTLSTATFDEQLKIVEEWVSKLEEAGKTGSESYEKMSTFLEKLKDEQKEADDALQKYNDALSELYAMSGQIDTFNTFLQSISDSYNIEGPKQLISELQAINQEFSDGTIDVETYFNKIEEKIASIDLTKEGEELEAYQAIFAATTSSLAEGIESLNAGLASGNVIFSDYATGIKEAGDNALDLYVKQNELTQDQNGMWVDANNNLNEYANNLQSTVGTLEDFSDVLKVIGDNYDYISANSNAAGEAIFKVADEQTQAFKTLAIDMETSLNQMRLKNQETFDAIVTDIQNDTGLMINEIVDSNGNINSGLFNNSAALNSALNSSAKQTGSAVQQVTTAMGKTLEKLGEAISNFSYTLKATPYINGDIGLRKDEHGVPNGLELPSFGFDITGEGGESVQGLGSALSEFGSAISSINIGDTFKYTPRNITTGGGTGSTADGTGRTGGSAKKNGGSSSSDSKAEEEAYKKRLAAFTDYIKETERLEKRWVDKQKKLGILTAEDEKYIIQQRIKRYEQYLQEIREMTWLSAEDRLKLEKEYTEEIEDLQMDYLDLLKDQLDDQIDALEDANKKKIELIEEEADKRIEALKKVEDENDRIRTKEEYLRKRQEHLDDISYWEQRTGREAQEALLEARKKLEELDREWEEQLEDWNIEDQIAAIEAERDAQIAAIEAAQEAEIASMQKIYDEKVKLFSETGQIIYDNSVLQSQALYEAYKTNFIDPIINDLNNLNNSTNTAASSSNGQYESYTIQRGDTLSKIAKKYSTTVEKIMAANPSITNKNKIYTGSTIQIPKFHEGGIFGGVTEGLALLKKGEVVLKPEWSVSLERMMHYFDNLSSNNQIGITNGPTINVDGDLIKIEASVKNQSDIDRLERRLEKMLKDKFNIKK